VERVLHDGPHLRLAPLVLLEHRFARTFWHRLKLAALHGDAPVEGLAQPAVVLCDGDLLTLFYTGVAAVAKDLDAKNDRRSVRSGTGVSSTRSASGLT